MVYMKIILKSLFKKKISSLFITIQLTITTIILLSSFIMINSQNYLQNEIKKKNVDLSKTIKLNIYNPTFSNNFKKNYNELENYINTIPEVTNFGAFDFTNFIFKELEENTKFIDGRKSMTKGTFKEQFPTTSEMLMIDKGIYD